MSKDFSLSHLCSKASSSAGIPCRWSGWAGCCDRQHRRTRGETDRRTHSIALSPGTCAGFWQGTKWSWGVPNLVFISLNSVMLKSRKCTPLPVPACLRGRFAIRFWLCGVAGGDLAVGNHSGTVSVPAGTAHRTLFLGFIPDWAAIWGLFYVNPFWSNFWG